MNKINFENGTLSFIIPEGAIDYGNNKFIYLVNYNDENGSLKVIKDRDNGLKIYYKFNNRGKCDLIVPAPELDSDREYAIVVAWSMANRKVTLYINTEERGSADIDITSE